ncbi:hypothetical protein SDC9_164128 [bioreactor metagenome]|uniref:Uncharacterized protein n=1 Tax=bioreactor metagenome TaxID=1076179 RepID=A0A645FT13_9ZZZZ
MRGAGGDGDDVLPVGHIRQMRKGECTGEHASAVVQRENAVWRAVDCENVFEGGNIEPVGNDGSVCL